MAYNSLYTKVFVALQYPCNNVNDNYQFTGTTPSNAIIAAVEALPSDPNTLYGLDLSSDEAGQTLQALVTGERWQSLLSWQATEYAEARCTAYQADPILMAAAYEALFNGTSLQEAKDIARSALSNAGLPVSI